MAFSRKGAHWLIFTQSAAAWLQRGSAASGAGGGLLLEHPHARDRASRATQTMSLMGPPR